MMTAETNVESPATKSPIFWPIPSWTRFMSELMRVVISVED
jgi:hypothetical protein